jgi:Mat/Ecp fimbriae major subunit
MHKFLRIASLGATVAALTLTAAPAFAAATTATADPQAKAQVRILKPLTLTAKQDLDLGTVALGQGTFSTTVGIAKDGTWTCDGTKVTCSGAHQVATYNVTGTNNRTVTITAGNVTLSNGTDNLTLTVDAPASVLLPNSGNTGVDFDIGGSVDLTEATPDGLYQGDFDVTADYQ